MALINMHWLPLFRICVLGWTIFCALLLIGLGAHALSAFGTIGAPSFAWAGLAVATGVLSLITVAPMLVVDIIRSGAFTSMIVVELSVLSFLGVLYLATGGSAAGNASIFWGDCNFVIDLAHTVCGEVSAAAAFGFLGWLALWAYTGTLLVLLIIHAQRSQYIWQQSVKQVDWRGKAASPATAPGVYDPEAKQDAPLGQAVPVGQVPYMYPPVSPQPTGYSQGISPQPTGHSQQYPQV